LASIGEAGFIDVPACALDGVGQVEQHAARGRMRLQDRQQEKPMAAADIDDLAKPVEVIAPNDAAGGRAELLDPGPVEDRGSLGVAHEMHEALGAGEHLAGALSCLDAVEEMLPYRPEVAAPPDRPGPLGMRRILLEQRAEGRQLKTIVLALPA